MGETLDSPGRSAGAPDPGWARLATLATGASALVVAGWCGAFVNRALDAGPSASAVPSVVLPPLSLPKPNLPKPNLPKPTVVAAPPPAPRPPSTSPFTATPAAFRTSGRVETVSASAPPAGPDRDATAVPVPVRAVRLAPAGPALSDATAAAPRLAAPSGPTRTAPEQPAGGGPAPTPDMVTPSVGPMFFLHGEIARRPFAAGAAHPRGAGPGRSANHDGRGSGDGDVDRG